MQLEYERNTCNNFSHGAGTKFLWLHLSVILCASVSIILHIKYIFSIIRRFKQIKMLYNQKRKPKGRLSRSFSFDDQNEQENPIKESEILVRVPVFKVGCRNNHTRRLRRKMIFTYTERGSSSSSSQYKTRMKQSEEANTVVDPQLHFQVSVLHIARMKKKKFRRVLLQMEKKESNNSRQ